MDYEHQKRYHKVNRFKDDVPVLDKEYEQYLDEIKEKDNAECNKQDNN